jgi:hypothetical protein
MDSANWLPDGRLLVTGLELVRVEPDGARIQHAGLSDISPLGSAARALGEDRVRMALTGQGTYVRS